MAKPELKPFGDFTPEDFDRHPVWIGSHLVDYGEPWYADTDEETFRPWTGNLPADESPGILLVKATFALPDGSKLPGFVTPSTDPGDLGIQQPLVFVRGKWFGFWGGLVGVSTDERQSFYAALARKPEEIFPLRFSVDPALASGDTRGQVEGFYRTVGDQVEIEL
jgi:hypothetical protein